MHLLLHLLRASATGISGATGTGAPAPRLDFTPKATLPGTGALSLLANGLGFWALIAAVLGVVVGGVMWAFGHYSQNYQQAYNGRKGVLVAGLAALLIGGAAQIVHFFTDLGHTVK